VELILGNTFDKVFGSGDDCLCPSLVTYLRLFFSNRFM
jgi:hypothetical protein